MGWNDGFRHLEAIADGSLEGDQSELRRRRARLEDDGVAVFLALAPGRVQLFDEEADRLVDGLTEHETVGPDAEPPACTTRYLRRIGAGTVVGEGHNGDENARVSRSWTGGERLVVAAACRLAARRLSAERAQLASHPAERAETGASAVYAVAVLETMNGSMRQSGK
jgi:hypothetical protein